MHNFENKTKDNALNSILKKPFICKVCRIRFSKKSDRRFHILNFHNSIKVEGDPGKISHCKQDLKYQAEKCVDVEQSKVSLVRVKTENIESQEHTRDKQSES